MSKSVFVPLIVAFIGVFSVLAGHGLNSWLEHKRHLLVQEREIYLDYILAMNELVFRDEIARNYQSGAWSGSVDERSRASQKANQVQFDLKRAKDQIALLGDELVLIAIYDFEQARLSEDSQEIREAAKDLYITMRRVLDGDLPKDFERMLPSLMSTSGF